MQNQALAVCWLSSSSEIDTVARARPDPASRTGRRICSHESCSNARGRRQRDRLMEPICLLPLMMMICGVLVRWAFQAARPLTSHALRSRFQMQCSVLGCDLRLKSDRQRLNRVRVRPHRLAAVFWPPRGVPCHMARRAFSSDLLLPFCFHAMQGWSLLDIACACIGLVRFPD